MYIGQAKRRRLVKAIRVSEDNWDKLMKMKAKYKKKSVNEVIDILTEMYEDGIIDRLLSIGVKINEHRISKIIDYILTKSGMNYPIIRNGI